ncbi:UDP-glycosyltransferase 91A1-like [Punica granatum]|uniref:UDP-glycosyltransferase 91A1-like n=1 Tax=Punica granatum TaxID=22663 RepID=A0A218W1L3_PUNGR|nr:UDP-glycosyltransferase 91A1-like [Punica granatum]OWM66200.1 hypothetical protein CDL15_Pgr013417 [Punica granatum]
MAEIVDHELHIVMFPWLAFGHMIPFIEVAKHMARKGHRISFVSTPQNIDRLPRISPELTTLIDFVKIPLPAVENLPENAEATSDLTYDKVQYLKKAYDLLREPMTRLLESLAPDFVIYDFVPYWLGPIARNLGIKTAMFSIYIAATLVFTGPTWASMGGDHRKRPEDFTVPPEWVPFKTHVAFPYFAIKRIFDAVEGNASGVSDMHRFGAAEEGADIITLRSSYEVEPEWLKLLEELHQKPVFPVGQLPPPSAGDCNSRDETKSWQRIKQWLDLQRKSSVVYVAFGSEAKPSQDELTKIALGLEKSGLPFFWVLRTQLGSSDTDSVKLPDGFEERVKGRGFVWTTWAPQVSILANDSVGGILTHSGWGSVVEALCFERALILFALLSDQGLNVRFMEEKKMGYPIPRNESDGSFTSDDVAESLRLVLVEEEGKVYRDKAKEMKEVLGNPHLQEQYMDNLLNHMKANRPMTRSNK